MESKNGALLGATTPAKNPAEGLLIRGQQGVDVGDQFAVKLVSTNPQRGFLDFAKDHF